MTKEQQLELPWEIDASQVKGERPKRVTLARPEYPVDMDAVRKLLLKNSGPTLYLSPPSKRQISGALNFLEKQTDFSPADFLPPLSQEVFQQYLNYPRPPRHQPVEWPSQSLAAQEVSLPGGAKAVKQIVLAGLIRVTRAAHIEDPVERLVLPWEPYDRLWQKGITQAEQLLNPSPGDLEIIWGVCFARPIYQELKKHLQEFQSGWQLPVLEKPIFSHELSPEDVQQLANLHPKTQEDEILKSIGQSLLLLRGLDEVNY